MNKLIKIVITFAASICLVQADTRQDIDLIKALTVFSENKEKGIVLLRKEAQKGKPLAQYIIGINLWTNNTKDEAIKWLREAEKNGYNGAGNMLTQYLFVGGLSDTSEQGLKWLREAAQRGNGNAQLHLGIALEQTNHKEAIIWFKESEKNGIESASKRLDQLLLNLGLDEKNENSINYLKEAAIRNNNSAQYFLGVRLWMSNNKEESIEWLKKAEKNGHKSAGNMLTQYLFVCGLSDKSEKSKKWLKEAAERGNENAQFFLNLNKE